MPVSYTFEKDVMWVHLSGKPTYKQFIKTIMFGFKDRRFIPGSTGIIYDGTTIDPGYSFSETEHQRVGAFMVANSISKTASIVADPERCRAACEFRDYLRTVGGETEVFASLKDTLLWMHGKEPTGHCDYNLCGPRADTYGFCRGKTRSPELFWGSKDPVVQEGGECLPVG